MRQQPHDRPALASGHDLITDFRDGAGIGDVIDPLRNSALNSLADVQAAANQSGMDTVIDMGGGSTVTLEGFTAANDFLF